MTTRTSKQTFLTNEGEPLVARLEQRLRSVLGDGAALGPFERLSLSMYEPGGSFKVHHDGGFRSRTFLMYLNDNFEGGATTFPCLGMTVIPRAGRLVTWSNGPSSREPAQRMLHYAEPVTSGHKIVAQQFVRGVGTPMR